MTELRDLLLFARFVHNDEESVKIRNMSVEETHMLLCHTSKDKCLDGCDATASSAQLVKYNKAFAEVANQIEDLDEHDFDISDLQAAVMLQY